MKKWAIKVHELFMYLRKTSISNGAAIWKSCHFYRLLIFRALLIGFTRLRTHFNIFKDVQLVEFSSRFLVQYQEFTGDSHVIPFYKQKDTLKHFPAFIMPFFWVVYLYGD
jgi:hypothetical protein